MRKSLSYGRGHTMFWILNLPENGNIRVVSQNFSTKIKYYVGFDFQIRQCFDVKEVFLRVSQ